jgi:lipoyl(octanoyl) transferase
MKPTIQIQDWGLIDYKKAWDQQSTVHKTLVDAKRSGLVMSEQGYLMLCEHPAVYTLGKSGSEANLLIDAEQRNEKGLQFYKINRGGDITHHGPGQIVGYPILDLEYWYRDVHLYVRNIEEVIIQTLRDYDILAIRIDGYTGVWTETRKNEYKKLCAIGVHLSRWVSMHGFALNVNNDLRLFDHIVPCGIQEAGKEVTSMSALLDRELSLHDVKSQISATFARIFECEIK